MSDPATPHGADRAGAAYWEGFWRRRRVTGLATRASFFHRRLVALLAAYAAPGAAVLEVGCGGSVWLPALARRGAACWGIDYSPAGLALLDRTLRRQRVAATLVEGNVLDPDVLRGLRFDLVYSVGLVEHFSPPDALLRRFAHLLTPGGVVITLVPNFTGLWGRLQRRFDRPVYDTHVIYAPAALDRVHAEAGLAAVETARYFGGFAPLVVNVGRSLKRLPRPMAVGLLASAWGLQQAVAWTTCALGVPGDSASRSGYIAGVYRAGRAAWP